MSSTALLLFLAAACSALMLVSSKKVTSDREVLINSAIAEVKVEFSANDNGGKLSGAQGKLRSFKKASPQAKAQGLASLKLERMVKLAEKKILKRERQATAQTTLSMAEALANELMHKPGSILTKDEMAKIYQASGCPRFVAASANCNGPLARFHRLPDGRCNNLDNPTAGAANTPMRRLIQARYSDGISRPTGFLQSQNSPLISGGVFSVPHPSPRVVSIDIVEDRQVNDTMHTHILMQWGQFMDHDLDAIPEHETNCTIGDACEIPAAQEGTCYPFAVPQDDPALDVTRATPTSVGCHGFHRSIGICPSAEEFPPRENPNDITHFIDASSVYGHSKEILNGEIRDLTSDAGLLRVGGPATEGSSRPLLPDAAPDSFVLCPEGVEGCFVAGDFRVNEQTGLTAMHTLWVREHNRIAQIIKDNNPNFPSEKVFLIAREIVAAEIQKITYQDYLPIILGDEFSTLIPPYSQGGYDPTVNPNIPNAFATAAYRFGHSQIQPFFERLDENYMSIPAGPLPLVDAFFNTSHVRQFGIEAIFRGLVAKPARQVDEFLNNILTNFLFANDANSPGLDLASLNIQRGRDHGLPAYLAWKQWAKSVCGVESEFKNQLTQIHLLQAYGGLDSVDLFVGGLAEKPLEGGLVGAVFSCIFARTFVAVRDGDRFFYENAAPDTAKFTADQREQIGMASLSRVICDNTDINEIQRNAFMANQDRVPCSQLSSVDLTVFNEEALPSTCYIRVGSDTDGRFNAVSRRVSGPGVRFRRQTIDADSAICYPVLCPVEGGETRVSVVSPQRQSCTAVPNRALPESISRRSRMYIARIDSDTFREPTTGLYTDLGSCQGGSVVGVSFECNAKLASKESVKVQNDDESTTSEDEIRRLLAEDDEDATGDILGDGSDNNQKLVSLMEEVLKELKSAKVSSHDEPAAQKQEEPEHEDKKTATAKAASDNTLTAELEMLLKEID